jgi:ankyrin repeat protein
VRARAALAVLLGAGADPDAPGPDGVSARRQALRASVGATAELFGGRGSDPVDGLLEAALAGDGDSARRLLAADPGLLGRLESAELATLVNAAERGSTPAVALMLELGFPIGTHRDGIDDAEAGASALHAAAWAGAADTVALLLERGRAAPADEIALDRGEPKQPSPAVLELLRSRGLTLHAQG